MGKKILVPLLNSKSVPNYNLSFFLFPVVYIRISKRRCYSRKTGRQARMLDSIKIDRSIDAPFRLSVCLLYTVTVTFSTTKAFVAYHQTHPDIFNRPTFRVESSLKENNRQKRNISLPFSIFHFEFANHFNKADLSVEFCIYNCCIFQMEKTTTLQSLKKCFYRHEKHTFSSVTTEFCHFVYSTCPFIFRR